MRIHRIRAGARRCQGPLLLAIAAAGFGGAAAAADAEAKHFVSFSGMYISPDSARGADYGSGFGIGYARSLDPNVWLEARAYEAVLDTGAEAAIDFYQTGFGLDLLTPLGDQSRPHLFVLAGGGVVANDVSPGDKSGTTGFLDAGIGWRGRLWESWGLRPRLEARGFLDYYESGTVDLQVALTLEIPPKPVRIVEKITEVEKIVKVPVEVEKIVEKEVVCVVAPVAAAAAPVPIDADNDGVPDDKDKCPGTLAGVKVDENGCARQEVQSITLPNIEFEIGSAVLTANGKEKLEPVVAFLGNQPTVQIEIVGHTDAQGGDAYNQKLSEDRARAVMEHLVGRGTAADRLSSKGMGESQPIASNKTKQGRAQNRRVELRIRVKG